MQSLHKNKKIKVRVKKRRFKKLSIFQLQNSTENALCVNWVNKKSI